MSSRTTPDPEALGSVEKNLLRSDYRALVLALLVVGATLNFLDRQILSILMQPIKEELHLSDTALGFLSGLAFALFYATLGIPVARIADRRSRRAVITISMFIWSAMTALCGLAQNAVHLFMARFGVGIGEAGFTPAANSLISDFFPEKRRGLALGLLNSGAMLGMMLGLVMGGWVLHHLGWRAAFLVAGLPGIFFAVIFWLVVREPPRGLADGRRPEAIQKLNLLAEGRKLWLNQPFRWVSLASCLSAFIVYGMSIWMPSFLIRSHGMDAKTVGFALGPVVGIVGGLGTIMGGVFADWLRARGPRGPVLLPAVASLLAIPLLIASLIAKDFQTCIIIYAFAYFVSVLYIAPSFSVVQSVLPLNARATGTAWKLLLTNLIGLGLGPQSVGVLSDILRPQLGQESLRWAMILSSLVLLAASMLYIRAANSLCTPVGEK